MEKIYTNDEGGLRFLLRGLNIIKDNKQNIFSFTPEQLPKQLICESQSLCMQKYNFDFSRHSAM